jgi:hypothetical protein
LYVYFVTGEFVVGKILEFLRIALVAIGFFLAYQATPEHSLFWMTALVVIPLNLLTGIEGIFFMKSSYVGKDWGATVDRFQIQGRLYFFAITVTALVVLLCKMNLQAQLTICLVSFTFFLMSSVNHLLSYLKEKVSKIHLERFILSVLLWAFFIPLVMRSYPHL